MVLAGSHTWDDSQDLATSASPAPFDFNAYVQFLVGHGHNATILWKKDLPQFCGWGAGGTWTIAGPWPWLRTGPGNASDGLPKFDLSQFDPSYFTRIRSRVIQLQQNGIYAIVQLFDGLQLAGNRCGTDGYPFTLGNNLQGVDDGGGAGSITMTAPNTITSYQIAFVQKMVDTLNDLDNVIWEMSEESPTGSFDWWQNYMMGQLATYEATKPYQHPVGLGAVQYPGDDPLLAQQSNAAWIAPMQVGQVVPVNQFPGKIAINDSDHSWYYTAFVSSSGAVDSSAVHAFAWENFLNGASPLFMDPYETLWTSGNRNLCPNPNNGICSGPDSKYDDFRNNLGYVVSYGNRMNLAAMSPQPSLSDTGYCLANPTAEFLIYAPNGGTFHVDLSHVPSSTQLTVEWFDPSTGVATVAGTVAGGSAATAFTTPATISGEVVLYLH